MDEQQYLLPVGNRNAYARSADNDSDEDEWTGSSSNSAASSFYTDDSESSDPEWETYIEESGQLLFIDCHPFVTTQPTTENESNTNKTLSTSTLSASTFVKNPMRKSTRSKFLRLIRRRDSKRRSKRLLKNDQKEETKVKFQDYNEGEVKIVILPLNQEVISRRSKIVEHLLGVNVSTFSDGLRIMIAGITPNGPAKSDKSIKIGDWLKSINDVNVNANNLNVVLEQFEHQMEVKLELQRVTGVEVTKQPPGSEISNQSTFVKQLTTISSNENLQLLLIDQPVGVVYLDVDNLTEDGPEFQGVLYCYPNPMEKNRLCMNRGVCITLNHLIEDVTDRKPQVTTVLSRSPSTAPPRLAHICYTCVGTRILLLMLPDNRLSRDEIVNLNGEVLRCLKFVYGDLDRCFAGTVDGKEVDHFFSRFFARILTSGQWNKAEQSVMLSSLPAKAAVAAPYQFEALQQAAHAINLPNEAKMQIDDALSELEACDYREWNDDPLDCQRLFTILGSALYHSGYLLATHLIHEDLVDVHVYCRQQGLFHLSQTEPVRSMVLWREVHPYSCNREDTNFLIPSGARHYLLVIGGGKDLLAVIMEAGGCTEPPEDNLPPDAFYVEEAQATLAHLQELGIAELAERWMRTNPGTQVTIPQLPIVKRRSELFLGPLANFNPLLSGGNGGASTGSLGNLAAKKSDLTSILKRRSNDQLQQVTQSTIFDDDLQSEDSQGNHSERSEISDEPILGRRAQRDRYKYSDDEESDIDDYRDGSQISQSSYDISELRNTLLNQTGDAQPFNLTTGKDLMLYHYVQLDFTEGILLSPPDCHMESKTLDLILDNFRKTTQRMHDLFQNTLRFKNMTSEEMSKSLLNKSLVAIKEHGMLFEVPYQDETPAKKTIPKIVYWVVGRLFFMPHPRELYVCYQDNVPQNMIDIAFKLGISTAV